LPDHLPAVAPGIGYLLWRDDYVRSARGDLFDSTHKIDGFLLPVFASARNTAGK
jgi:hypothetical protein